MAPARHEDGNAGMGVLMRAVKALIRLAFIAAAFAGASGADAAEPENPRLTPIVADVLAPPHAVLGSDGRMHLVYEVKIANATGGRISLRRIAVIDGQVGTPMATLDTDALGRRFSLGGSRGSESTELGPFQFGVVFMHVALQRDAPTPAALAHVVEGVSHQRNTEFSIRLAATSVIVRPAPALGAPLRGRGYVAADGCCDSIRHVRALLPLNGSFYLSQRFAIDWERIDGEGRLFRGDPKDTHSYHIYGEPVLAVADATVIASRNDLADQVPGKLPQGLPIGDADGNFVVLDIGRGAYALYAHMRRGSVRLRAGDRVRRGDHIGSVGNSGNSQAPHLHFHVMDAPSGLASNGIPYVFDAFSVTAVDEAGTADFDRAEASGTPLTLTPRVPPTQLEGALPLDLTVVDWGN